MQQFQVPQFIQVEDKIFGPLTAKQFVYVLGGVGFVTLMAFLPIPKLLFWLLAGAGGSFFGALAFYKINNQPFTTFLNNLVNHYSGPRLFVWKRAEKKQIREKSPDKQTSQEIYNARLSESKLKELSWSLDINEKIKR